MAQGRSCHWARYVVDVHRDRALAAREAFAIWVDKHTLHDVAYSETSHAWPRSVREVQVVFPGTDGWLMSCSDAEGGHGRWVGYGGVSYSTWLRDSNTVGGNMQFRFGTFSGMFRYAVDYVTGKGYRVPDALLGDDLEARTRAWRSALGQALAAGWARYTGNDNSHWSASWNNGC